MTTPRQGHWQQVYTTKAEDAVSWFEESPALSLALLDAAGLTTGQAIIDIGGGASRLVDALLARGQKEVSVLDLSSAALETARSRVGADAAVEWIVADVTTWRPTRSYDFWHDRAALHFLTEADDQAAYGDALRQALPVGGVAIIGTFAPGGPEKCSGLQVIQHDSQSLSRLLGDGFVCIGQRQHDHVTPSGAVQKFQFSTFRRQS